MATCNQCGKPDLIWLVSRSSGKYYLAELRGKRGPNKPHFLTCRANRRTARTVSANTVSNARTVSAIVPQLATVQPESVPQPVTVSAMVPQTIDIQPVTVQPVTVPQPVSAGVEFAF